MSFKLWPNMIRGHQVLIVEERIIESLLRVSSLIPTCVSHILLSLQHFFMVRFLLLFYLLRIGYLLFLGLIHWLKERFLSSKWVRVFCFVFLYFYVILKICAHVPLWLNVEKAGRILAHVKQVMLREHVFGLIIVPWGNLQSFVALISLNYRMLHELLVRLILFNNLCFIHLWLLLLGWVFGS